MKSTINDRAAYMAKQRRALERRLVRSTQYLRMVEREVQAHPGDAFYARQVAAQQDEVGRIERALAYATSS